MMGGVFQFSGPPEAGGEYLALPGPGSSREHESVGGLLKKFSLCDERGNINLAVSQQIISVRSWMVWVMVWRVSAMSSLEF